MIDILKHMPKRTSKKISTNVQNLVFSRAMKDEMLNDFGIFNAVKDAVEEYYGYIECKRCANIICATHYIENATNTCNSCRWENICTTGIGRVR